MFPRSTTCNGDMYRFSVGQPVYYIFNPAPCRVVATPSPLNDFHYVVLAYLPSGRVYTRYYKAHDLIPSTIPKERMRYFLTAIKGGSNEAVKKGVK